MRECLGTQGTRAKPEIRHKLEDALVAKCLETPHLRQIRQLFLFFMLWGRHLHGLMDNTVLKWVYGGTDPLQWLRHRLRHVLQDGPWHRRHAKTTGGVHDRGFDQDADSTTAQTLPATPSAAALGKETRLNAEPSIS